MNNANRDYRAGRFAKAREFEATAKSHCEAMASEFMAASKNTLTTYWIVPVLGGTLGQCIQVKATNVQAGVLQNHTTADFDRNQSISAALATEDTTAIDPDLQKKLAAIEAKYKADVSPLSQAVGYVIDFIVNIVAAAFASMAALAGKVMDWSFRVNNETGGPVIINQVWTIVRDIFNMFFIIGIIVISLGKILRLREYDGQTGKLILNLIVMALLINFSKVIAETLILFSDTLTGLFLENVKLSGIFSNMSAIVTNNNGFSGFFEGGAGGALHALTYNIGKLVFTVVLFFTFVMLAGLFFIRKIGLWVMIAISPIYFAMSVLPFTRQYSTRLSGMFTKYLTWGPVAAFFIYMSSYILQTRTTSGAGYKSFAGDINIDFLIITGFLWAGYVAAKGSGMIGAEMVTKFTDKGLSSFKTAGGVVARYVARGSALKHLGSYTGIKPIEKVGEKWVSTAQNLKAIPASGKKVFEQFSRDYDKGVAKKQRAQTRVLSRFLPKGFDAESLEKDDVGKWDADETYNVIKARIESGKFGAADFSDLVPNLSRRNLRGLVKLWKDNPSVKNWTPDYTKKLDEALKRKLGTGDLGGADLLQEHPVGTTSGRGINGFVFDPTKDDPYNMRLLYNKKKGKGAGAAVQDYDVKMDATYDNDMADFIGEDKEKVRQSEFAAKLEKFDRTVKAAQALTNDPDAENKLRERAFTAKDIFAPEDINRVREELKDQLGVNLRVDLDPQWGSLLSRSGQRVKLSAKVATDDRIDMELNEARYYPKERIGDLVKVLRESGEMNESDINKMIASAEKAGGIQVVRGVPRTDKRALSEIVNLQIKSEPAQVRQARQAQGAHEGTHSVLTLIKRSNKELYNNIVKTITTFDTKKFDELENEIRNFTNSRGEQPYQNISKDDIVEEIISNKKFSSKLPPNYAKQITELLAPAVKAHTALRVKTDKELRGKDRLNELARKYSQRSKEKVPDEATNFDLTM